MTDQERGDRIETLVALTAKLQRAVHERAVASSPMFSVEYWKHNAGPDWPEEPDDGSYMAFENCVHPDCRLVCAALASRAAQGETPQKGTHAQTERYSGLAGPSHEQDRSGIDYGAETDTWEDRGWPASDDVGSASWAGEPAPELVAERLRAQGETPPQKPMGDDASREAAKRMSVRGPSPDTTGWGFHLRDNRFFRRGYDGTVEVRQVRETSHGPMIDLWEIPANEWASIVAHVSARGETSEQYVAAFKFHHDEAALPGIVPPPPPAQESPTPAEGQE